MKLEAEVINITKNILNDWVKENLPTASKETQDIIEQAKLDWIIDLTNQLFIIYGLKDEITEGRLIILNTILGSLIESWLKFFYSVYYENYMNEDTSINKKCNDEEIITIAPNELYLEKLKQFSAQVFDTRINNLISSIQSKRNMIHSFNEPKSTIGSINDFESNLAGYVNLLKSIETRLPHIEWDWERN